MTLPRDSRHRDVGAHVQLGHARPTRFVAATLALILVAVAGFRTALDDDLFKLRKNFEIFGSLYEQLVLGYVDELDSEQVMQRGIAAMLGDLDPYTVFSDQSQQLSYAAAQNGYVQVGLNLGMKAGQMTVLEPASDASAYKQGIRVGDVVTEIAGRDAGTLSLKDALTLLQGEPGTTVELSVSREGAAAPISFVLTRQRERTGSVPLAEILYGDSELGIGYIKLSSFQQNSHREFRRALNELRETGQLRAVVVDLRDNLGGYVDAAVAILEMFVPKGSTVLTMRGRTPDTVREFKTTLDPIDGDVPVIVLINDLSASASEIVAGAIQDLDRGVIVGTPSFGKGLVQTVRALPYNTALKLTIARYYTPSGRSIQAIDYRAHDGSPQPVPDSLRTSFTTAHGRIVNDGRGIEPDLVSRSTTDVEIENALNRQSAFFLFANTFAATHETIAADFRIDDETYESFKRWLAGRDFEYRSASDEALDALQAAVAASGYDAQEAIGGIRESLRQEKARDLDRYRDRLELRLRDEIAARYFERPEYLRSLLFDDPEIETAIALIRDRTRYDAALRPK